MKQILILLLFLFSGCNTYNYYLVIQPQPKEAEEENLFPAGGTTQPSYDYQIAPNEIDFSHLTVGCPSCGSKMYGVTSIYCDPPTSDCNTATCISCGHSWKTY